MSETALHLAAIAADNSPENVEKHIRLLEDSLPASQEELQACIQVFNSARKSAACQVVYERFIRRNPHSWDTKIAYAELKAGLGTSLLDDLSAAEDNFADLTFVQIVRLAELAKQVGYYRRAIDITLRLPKAKQTSVEVIKVLVPCHTGLGQASKAKALLQTYQTVMAGSTADWAYIVDEASKLGVEQLFQKWADSFEAKIPAEDSWSKFLLVRSYSRFIANERMWSRIVTKVDHLVSLIDIAGQESEWILGILLDVTETLGLRAHVLTLAHRLLVLNRADFDLAKRVRTIVDQHAAQKTAPFPFL